MLDCAETLSVRTKRFLPYLLAVAIFMQMLDTTILNTALPSIAYDLNASPLTMHSVVISYTLILAIFTPISGYLADRFGTKTLFSAAIFFFTLGSLLCALAPNLTALIGGRMVQGLGGAFLTPVARLALIKSYPRDEIMPVLNFAVMPALIGPLIGPMLGGYIVEVASWHWIFLINLPIGALAFIAGLSFMPNLKERCSKLDLKGFLLFSSGLFLSVYGFDRLGHGGHLVGALIGLILGGTLFALYWRYAAFYEKALFPTKLWLIRTYRVGLTGNLVARLGMSAIPFLVPLYLQVARGYSPSEAGFMLIPIAAAGLSAKPFIPHLLRRIGYRPMLVVNTMILTLIISAIAYLGESLSKPGFMALLFLAGFSNSCQFSTMNTLTIARLRPDHVSAGSTLMVVNQQLALSLGVALSALLLNLYPHFVPEATKMAQFKFTFGTVAFFTFASSFVFMRLHKHDGEGLIKKRSKDRR